MAHHQRTDLRPGDGEVVTLNHTFEEELAYAEAEVIAAINAERVMAEVIGR